MKSSGALISNSAPLGSLLPMDDLRSWLLQESRRRDCYIELASSQSASRHLQLRQGVLDQDSTNWSWDLDLRVLDQEGRQGLAALSLGRWDWPLINQALDQAVSAMKYSHADPWNLPPEREHDRAREHESIEADLSFDSRSWIGLLKQWNAQLKNFSAIEDVLDMSLGADKENRVLVSSRELFRQESLSDYSWATSLVAGKGMDVQNFGAGLNTVLFEKLCDRVPFVGAKAAKTAAGLLHPRRVLSGRYRVIFDPWLMAEALSLLAPIFCADQVLKGFSPWKDQLGTSVMSPLLTILDNGRLPQGCASRSWDDEGTPTQETVLVDQGKLVNFLHSLKTARQCQVKTTASAYRSAGGVLNPGISNFFIKAGSSAPDQILRETTKGVYLMELQGLHTVDTATGDFSLGGAGFWIENGERAWALQEITVAGNLFEMLNNVDAVGSDLEFEGALASPTVSVSALDIGGENHD